jgi:ubiquinone/menaquinone biosynthesis C-methylase UbiE
MHISEKILFSISKYLLTRAPKETGFRNQESLERFKDIESYLEQREGMVSEYHRMFKKYASFEDKVILDLGCAAGSIANYFALNKAKKVYGADISKEHLNKARSIHNSDNLEFVLSTPTKIPLPDATVDIIICIDTMEHIMYPEIILDECWRVLKFDGIFFIYFQPWYGVYGAHLEHIIPIPWCHILFRTEVLSKIAARIYDCDSYSPAHWDYDENRQKKPNPFLTKDYTKDFLNKISLRQFRNHIRSSRLQIEKVEKTGFKGSKVKISRHFNFLGEIPLLEEVFVNFVLYVLKKK